MVPARLRGPDRRTYTYGELAPALGMGGAGVGGDSSALSCTTAGSGNSLR